MRLIERNFSDREEFPSILIVNLHTVPDVEKNLAVMERIVETAHRKGANILIFPELAVTGHVWDDPEDPEDRAVRELLRQGDNDRIAPFIKRIHGSLCNDKKGLEYVFYNNVRKKDDFDYSIDFNRFYNRIDDAGSHPVDCDPDERDEP